MRVLVRDKVGKAVSFGQHNDIPLSLFCSLFHMMAFGMARGKESMISFVTVLQTEIPPCRRIHQS